MKKHLISVLFALILGVMFFCVSASATEAETTKAEKWYNESHAVTGMVMDLTVDDGYLSSTQRVYSKGSKAASEIDLDGSVLRVISNGKDLILFSPDMPIIHVKFKGLGGALAEVSEGMPATEFALDFVKAYEHTEGEKTYYIEEFTNDDGVIYKYYFLGEELILVDTEVASEGETARVRIMIISYEVDDKIFEVPWYSINLYPIVMLITLFSLI